MQLVSGSQRPDLLTSLTHVSLVLRLPREMRLCRPSLPKSGPNLRYFVHFDLEMYFAPQRRATFHLSSDQMAPNSALERAYFSNLRSHKTLVKHTVSRLFYLFGHLHLLSSDYFSSDSVSSLAARTIVAASVHKSEVWLLNFLRWAILKFLRKWCAVLSCSVKMTCNLWIFGNSPAMPTVKRPCPLAPVVWLVVSSTARPHLSEALAVGKSLCPEPGQRRQHSCKGLFRSPARGKLCSLMCYQDDTSWLLTILVQ